MRVRRVSNQPIRLAAGAFILNSGIEKLQASDDRAERLHSMAKGPFPFFDKIPSSQFAKGLAIAEIALGGALVLPLVPDRLAGLALTPFAGGLVWMYTQTDGMTKENSIRPSGQGTALAKDVWLLGIGLTLLTTRRAKRPPSRA